LDDLRSEYIDLFDRQQGHIPLYETEYGPGRSLAKGHDLADLAGFYHAFGVELADLEGSGRTELPDHVAVELEFYGYLLRKEAHLQSVHDQVGGEIVADARRKFLRDHLGGFLPSIAEQVAGTSSRTYQEIFAWCSALVRDECERMQAEPGALRARSGDPDEGELSCGALPIVR
jgi:nitrate reductase assembly molybdenum cofactor insertion protein NarJ